MVKKLCLLVSLILFFETGCVSTEDPNKRGKRALAGGATSTALGIATGVGGPILLARAALGATSRTVTGEVMDKAKDKEGGEESVESGEKIDEAVLK